MKFLFLSALLLPLLVVTVTAASAVSRSRSFTLEAIEKSDRCFRITPESSCGDDDHGPLDINDDHWMRNRSPSTLSGRSSSSSRRGSSFTQQPFTSTGIKHRHTDNDDLVAAFLTIRGGAAPPSSLPPSSIVQDSWKSLLSFSQGVFRDHVQPALADPEHKLLKPVQAFLKQQATAAAERGQSYPRRAKNANANKSSTSTSASASASTNSIFQQPARILRLILVALVLAQVLETTGILENADGNVQQKLLAAWETHGLPHWEELQDWAHNVRHLWWAARCHAAYCVREWWWVARQTRTGLLSATTWSDPVLLSNSWQEQVSPKYRTAIGLGIGLVCAPFLWTAGEGLLKTGTLLYLVAEVVHQILESPFVFWWQEQPEEEDNWFTRPAFGGGNEPDGTEWELDVAATVRDLLETWRQTVRDTVQSVREGRDSWSWSSKPPHRRGATGGPFPPHLRSGVILGTVIGVLVGA
jgi:hypothetical protein